MLWVKDVTMFSFCKKLVRYLCVSWFEDGRMEVAKNKGQEARTVNLVTVICNCVFSGPAR